MENHPATINSPARLGAGWWFVVAMLLCAVAVRAAGSTFVNADLPVVCPGSISPTNRPHGYGGGGPYSISVLLQCDWIVINTNSWITITSPTNGNPAGASSLTYTLEANTDPEPRSGNVTIGGHNLFVAQAGDTVCILRAYPGGTWRGYAAARGTFFVAAPEGYAWDIVNTNSWITILSATNQVGSATVEYEVEANTDLPSRSGEIAVGCAVFHITQFGHGSVSLPADQTVALGGTATFSVTVPNITTPSYQWQFIGVDLVDGGGISGATTPNLVLTGVQYSQAGHYRVVVNGDIFSSTATLTVAPTSDALPLAEALDTGDSFFWKIWSDSSGIWFGQTNTTHDGIDALECSGLAPGEFASLETKSGGLGILSFWWKTAFASPSDNLLFWIGSSQSAALTNTTDWERRRFAVPPGDVNLRWTLSKSSSTGEQTKAWLDQVEFTPCDFQLSSDHTRVWDSSMATTGTVTVTAAADCPWTVVNPNSWISILSSMANTGSGSVTYVVAPNHTGGDRDGVIVIAGEHFDVYQLAWDIATNRMSLTDVLDTEGSLDWSTIGAPEWFGQTIVSRDGAGAAQSGPIGDGEATTVTTTVNGPGTILFWWKVSSGPNKDYLKFFVNGVQQTRISGEVDWQLVTYELTSVTNTLKWTYSKNDSVALGQDRGWLDQVQFIPATAASCVLAISPISATVLAGLDTGSVSVVAGAGCAWDVVNTNSWITCTVDSGVGNGLVRYTVSANDSRSLRTGVLFVGGRPFTVTQPAGIPPCSYSLSPASVAFASASATGTVTITTQLDCDWTVFNTNAWITITSSPNGSGSGQVAFSLSQNTSAYARSGQLRIGDRVFTVTQSGRPIPLAEALETDGTPLNWGGGTWFGQWDVTHDGVDAAQSGPTSWDGGSALGATVTGPGTLTFWWKISAHRNSVLDFSVGGISLARLTGEVDWQPYSLPIAPGVQSLAWYYMQYYPLPSGPNAAWLDQVQFVPTPICPITLTPLNASHPSSSSTGLIDVAAAPDCAWFVSNTNSWISILGGANGMGNGSVTYILTANPTTSARSGNIQIADGIFSVTQSAGATNPPSCTISISPTNRIHIYTGGSNSVFVTTQPGCAWSVLTTNAWISILSSANRSGSGAVLYSLGPNTNSPARTGVILIGGQLFRLTQQGIGTNAAQLQIMTRTATNTTFSVQGDTGKMYLIECSEDLLDWTPISTNSAPSTVTDAAVSTAPRRFYRTVEVP